MGFAKALIKLSFFIFYAVYSFGQSKSQVINGIVLDSISKLPLPSASIELKREGIAIQNLLSNKDGKFEFKNTEIGTYELVVKYVGYKVFKNNILINNETLLVPPIYLVFDNINLNAVTIKASKPIIQQELDKVILNVDGTSLSNSGSTIDILKFAPFVQAENSSVLLKGKPVMILIDGKLVNAKNESLEGLLNSMPSQSIEMIELISNPGAKYEASGKAVINIKTLKAKNFGSTGNLTLGVGTGILPRYNGGILLNYKKEKFSFIGNYTNQFTQQYIKSYNERTTKSEQQRYFEDNDYEERTRRLQFAKIGIDYYATPKTTIGLLIQADKNERLKNVNGETQIGLNNAKIDSIIKMKFNGGLIFSNLNNNLYLKHSFEEKGRELSIDLDYGLYDTNWNDEFNNTFLNLLTNNNYRNDLAINTLSDQLIKIQSFKANYTHPFKTGLLEGGVQFRRTILDMNFQFQSNVDKQWTNDPKKSFDYNYTETVNAAFLEYENKWKKIEYKFGLRGESTDAKGINLNNKIEAKQNYIQLFPSSSIQFSPSDTNQFTFTYSRKIVRPEYTEFNNQIIFANLYKYYLGNPYLKPALTNTLELNYSYKQTLLFTATYLTTKNEYTSVPLIMDNSIVLQNQNFMRYDWIIFDISYNKNITNNWQTSSGVEYYQTRNHLESIPGLDFQIGNSFYVFSNNNFKFKNNWKLDLSTYYISPQVVGIVRWKPFYRTNVSLQKSIFSKRGEVRLNVTDIFNTMDYRYSFFSNLQSGIINRKAESRFFQLSFNYKFGNSNIKVKEKKTGIDKEKNRINNSN